MTQLEAKRINNIAFLFPPSGLALNPSVCRSGVFQLADLPVFRGAVPTREEQQDSRQGLPWKEAIRGCVFRWRQKSRCKAQEQTAEEGVHQFPPAAHRSARYRCWFPAAHCSSGPSETHQNWIDQSLRWSP